MKSTKPFYKAWWFITIAAFVILATIGAIIDEEDKEVAEEKKVEVSKEVDTFEENQEINEDTIDTSVFSYAKSVNVTNAIDITEHVTIQIEAPEETNPGLAVQHILSQTFDFLQQEDLNGAKTVTIFVNHKNDKVMQITVNKDDFVPNDTDPMISLVLEASEIEKMTPDVKEHGKIMGTW